MALDVVPRAGEPARIPHDRSDLPPSARTPPGSRCASTLHPLGEPWCCSTRHASRRRRSAASRPAATRCPDRCRAHGSRQDAPAGDPSAYRAGADSTSMPAAAAPGGTTSGSCCTCPTCGVQRDHVALPRRESVRVGNRPACRRCASTRSSIDPERGRVRVRRCEQCEAEARSATVCSVSATLRLLAGRPVRIRCARASAAGSWQNVGADPASTGTLDATPALRCSDALDDLPARTRTVIVEIDDSLTHELDLSVGRRNRRRGRTQGAAPCPTVAVDSRRRAAATGDPAEAAARVPRPTQVTGAAAALTATSSLRCGSKASTSHAARRSRRRRADRARRAQPAARDRLHARPWRRIHRQARRHARPLHRPPCSSRNDYGFTVRRTETAFDQTPASYVERSIAGALAIDTDYRSRLTDSIVDAGTGVGVTPPALAIGAATGDPAVGLGPAL